MSTDVEPIKLCECVLCSAKKEKLIFEFKVIVIWRTCNIHILLNILLLAIILDKKVNLDLKIIQILKKQQKHTYF